MNEKDLGLLRLLSARMKDDPRFMAHVLDVYCRKQGLDEAELANRLSAPLEDVVRLALCKKPDPKSPHFDEQVRQLACHTSINELQLIELLRAVDDPVPQAAGVARWVHWVDSSLTLASLNRLARSFIVGLTRREVFVAAAAFVVLVVGASVVFWSGLLSKSSELVATRDENYTRQTEKRSEAEDAARANADGRRPHDDVPVDKPNVTPSPIPHHANTRPADQSLSTLKSGFASEPLKKAAPQVAVAAIVRLRFDDRGTLRDARARPNAERNIISLRPMLTRFEIKLPRGSTAGSYDVSIQGAFGEPLLSNAARSVDGRSLWVAMDLRALAPKSYYLCVQKHNELPDCNPVTIIDGGVQHKK